jgi:hypothetical protein
VVFLSVSLVLLLAGQTMAVLDYDLAVRLGLQQSPGHVSEFGVRVNRAFGAADTVVYIPLILASLCGLLLKTSWSLLTTAAVAGISAYWSVTVSFISVFLPGTSGYAHPPGTAIWMFVPSCLFFGFWSLALAILRGPALIR